MPEDLSQWTGTWLDRSGVLVSSQSSGAQVDSRSNLSSESWARADRYKALLCFLYGFHLSHWWQATNSKIPSPGGSARYLTLMRLTVTIIVGKFLILLWKTDTLNHRGSFIRERERDSRDKDKILPSLSSIVLVRIYVVDCSQTSGGGPAHLRRLIRPSQASHNNFLEIPLDPPHIFILPPSSAVRLSDLQFNVLELRDTERERERRVRPVR